MEELFDIEEEDFGLYEEMDDFSFDEEEEEPDNRYIRPVKKAVKRHFVKYDNARKLAAKLTMDVGERWDVIVSHYFYAHELHALIPYIYRELDMGDRFQLAVATIHTKTALIHTLGGKKIVIHGSANLRSCGNIEQFTIEEQPELYGFYERIDDSILQEYATIRKYIPKSRLSEIINLNNEP